MAAAKKSSIFSQLVKHDKEVGLIETGIDSYDMYFGGYKPGDVVGISGEEACGKSTFMLQLATIFCNKGQRCFYFDAEAGLEHQLLENFGLNTFYSSDHTSAQFFMLPNSDIGGFMNPNWNQFDRLMTEIVFSDNGFDHVFLDSITQLGPYIEKDVYAGEMPPFIKSKQQSEFFLRNKSSFRVKGTTFWYINQLRNETTNSFIVTASESGGKSLRYNSDVMIRVVDRAKANMLTEKDITTIVDKNKVVDNGDPVGILSSIQARKSRKGPSFQKVPFPFLYGKGISNTLTLVETLKNKKGISGGNYITLPNFDPETGEDLKTDGGYAGLRAYVSSNTEKVRDYLKRNNLYYVNISDFESEDQEVFED